MCCEKMGLGWKRCVPGGCISLLGSTLLCLLLCCWEVSSCPISSHSALEPASHRLNPLKRWTKVNLSSFKFCVSDILSQWYNDENSTNTKVKQSEQGHSNLMAKIRKQSPNIFQASCNTVFHHNPYIFVLLGIEVRAFPPSYIPSPFSIFYFEKRSH